MMKRLVTRVGRENSWLAGCLLILTAQTPVTGQCEPVALGSLDTPSFAFDVEVEGTVAYIADFASGLQIVDISDPTDPTVLGTINSCTAMGVGLSGSFAYVADLNKRLCVIDVSDPANPMLVGSAAVPGNGFEVAISGTTAYIANSAGGVPESGLHIVDVSDPANPTVLGGVAIDFAVDVALSGSIAYVASFDTGLVAVDVSDPSDPMIIGALNLPGQTAGVSVAGDIAYAASTGLRVIDISDPTNPVLLTTVDTPNDATNIAISGSLAFTADGNLQIIDISVPEAASLIGTFSTPDSAAAIAILATAAFVADFRSGLQIIDVSSCGKGEPCLADIDGSGSVDFGDILAILGAWGNAGGPEDLDGSGTVDFGDLLVVLGSWGPCE